MKILVYGAGVLGSVYASLLSRAGEDVTVLARGSRYEDIAEHGILLMNTPRNQILTTPVKLTGRLEPQDAYDLIIVTVRKNQIADVLPDLNQNTACRNILFLMSNPTGFDEIHKKIDPARVLAGFPGVVGSRGKLLVRFRLHDRRFLPTTLGELDGAISRRLLDIALVFEKAGFPVKLSRNVDAFLKTHAAIITPLSNALYLAGGSPFRLARTRDGLVLLVRAVRENLSAIQDLGVPVTPGWLRLIELLPEPILVGLLQWILPTQAVEEIAAYHVVHSRPEMAQLSAEVHELTSRSSVATPSATLLCAYLDPATPPLPSSSHQIPMRWRGAAMLGLASGMFLMALTWLRLGPGEES